MVPLANHQTNPEQVEWFFAENQSFNVLLLQLEIRLETVLYAAQQAKSRGVTVVFDPAPAFDLPDRLYKYVDIITPNETEATVLTQVEVQDVESAQKAAQILLDKGVLVANQEGTHYHPAYQVVSVDSTAAGDAFTGALGASLAQGCPFDEALRYALAAGALAVTKLGAQSSLPTKDELEQLIESGKRA